MAYRRRKGGPRGRKCTRYKRVKMRGNGYVRRCAKYGAKSSGGSRRSRRSPYRRGRRRPAGMAKRGSRCTRWKRVRVRGQGYARRCAHYSGTGRRRRRGYR